MEAEPLKAAEDICILVSPTSCFHHIFQTKFLTVFLNIMCHDANSFGMLTLGSPVISSKVQQSVSSFNTSIF